MGGRDSCFLTRERPRHTHPPWLTVQGTAARQGGESIELREDGSPVRKFPRLHSPARPTAMQRQQQPVQAQPGLDLGSGSGQAAWDSGSDGDTTRRGAAGEAAPPPPPAQQQQQQQQQQGRSVAPLVAPQPAPLATTGRGARASDAPPKGPAPSTGSSQPNSARMRDGSPRQAGPRQARSATPMPPPRHTSAGDAPSSARPTSARGDVPSSARPTSARGDVPSSARPTSARGKAAAQPPPPLPPPPLDDHRGGDGGDGGFTPAGTGAATKAATATAGGGVGAPAIKEEKEAAVAEAIRPCRERRHGRASPRNEARSIPPTDALSSGAGRGAGGGDERGRAPQPSAGVAHVVVGARPPLPPGRAHLLGGGDGGQPGGKPLAPGAQRSQQAVSLPPELPDAPRPPPAAARSGRAPAASAALTRRWQRSSSAAAASVGGTASLTQPHAQQQQVVPRQQQEERAARRRGLAEGNDALRLALLNGHVGRVAAPVVLPTRGSAPEEEVGGEGPALKGAAATLAAQLQGVPGSARADPSPGPPLLRGLAVGCRVLDDELGEWMRGWVGGRVTCAHGISS
jgi:hypothetical protein